MATNQAHRLGQAIRARRAELGITLEQLAQASAISRGTLSRIENNSLSTSLTNALTIATALATDLGELLDDRDATLVPATEAVRFTDSSGIVRTSLAQPSAGVELIAYEVPPGSTSADFPSHRGRTQEVLHVLAGELVYEVGDTVHTMTAGDTLTARADQPHRFHNPGRKPCTLHMLTITPR